MRAFFLNSRLLSNLLTNLPFISEENHAVDVKKRLEELENYRQLSKLRRQIDRQRGRSLSEEQYLVLVNKLNGLKGKQIYMPRIVRSLKEYMICLIDEKVIDVLDTYGICGLERGTYQGLARGVLSELYDYLLYHPAPASPNRLEEIFNHHLKRFKRHVHLNQRVIRRIYLALLDIMSLYPRIKARYESKCAEEGLPFIYIRGEAKTTLLP